MMIGVIFRSGAKITQLRELISLLSNTVIYAVSSF